ncbi:MAG: cation diffusion facilitator family transporter [Rhizobiales bacterium]|nr:cation diffusion facilitator family transporter [Hyphomicrobiales bacterium]
MSAHHHSHAHDHDHAPGNERRVLIAMWITGSFMFIEVLGGLYAGSLALIADAGHMLTDTGALLMAWLALRLTRKPADTARSYGYQRAEILAAFVNGIAMLALVVWIIFEAGMRIADPQPVLGGIMLWVAMAGLAVNVVSFFMLHGGEDNLNIRGAALHVLGDLLGSVAAIVAAAIIMATGFMAIDPILSVIVALLIARSAWSITRQSAHILMEGTPPGTEPETIAQDLIANVSGVTDIHHIHAWSLSSSKALVTLHATLRKDADATQTLADLKSRLAGRFDIEHATIQIEGGDCPDKHAH